jgi:hypothetical protein
MVPVNPATSKLVVAMGPVPFTVTAPVKINVVVVKVFVPKSRELFSIVTETRELVGTIFNVTEPLVILTVSPVPEPGTPLGDQSVELSQVPPDDPPHV